MIYSTLPLAQSIVQICLAKGVEHIVISPGSRNAPLTISFAGNPKFKCYSIADERCAGFFALGMAQQLRKPVAVVCTSGSALLNYYPAFAEAFYSQIPLIVISADRPLHKIDIGDGQTIRQMNVFQNHSLYNANLTEGATVENDYKINEAITIARTRRGPTHINAPFEEPLYQTTRKPKVDPTLSGFAKVFKSISIDEIIACTNIWNSARKKLILIGVNAPQEIDEEVIRAVADDPSIVVMTEATSNISHPSFVDHIDTLITPFKEKDFEEFRPDILVTLGGMIVSKRVKAMLRTHQPSHHWHIDPLRAYNTFGTLAHHFEATPNDFFRQVLPFTKVVKSNYAQRVESIMEQRKQKHRKYLSQVPFCDLKAFEIILRSLPSQTQLQISNSSAIRYALLFDIDPTISVFCNRGTSGIDGSTSTAVGAAVASGMPTTLITGDVGFLYDSNALWNQYIPKDFKIILINNGGGGIFRILPGHQETPVFNTFFETSHQLNAEHLAKMYQFDYLVAKSAVGLEKQLKAAYRKNDRPVILEIFTPTKENDKILLQYFKELN